jgi:hypothetical protein
MRKHHIEAIARAFASVRATGPCDARQWTADVQAIATVLGRFNRGFDYARFLRACEARTSGDYVILPDGGIAWGPDLARE